MNLGYESYIDTINNNNNNSNNNNIIIIIIISSSSITIFLLLLLLLLLLLFREYWIARVISKWDEREARGRFEITSTITPWINRTYKKFRNWELLFSENLRRA